MRASAAEIDCTVKIMEEDRRRVGIFKLSTREVINSLYQLHGSHFVCFGTIPKLPADFQVVSVSSNFAAGCIEVMVRSQSFEPVPEFAEAPIIRELGLAKFVSINLTDEQIKQINEANLAESMYERQSNV